MKKYIIHVLAIISILTIPFSVSAACSTCKPASYSSLEEKIDIDINNFLYNAAILVGISNYLTVLTDYKGLNVEEPPKFTELEANVKRIIEEADINAFSWMLLDLRGTAIISELVIRKPSNLWNYADKLVYLGRLAAECGGNFKDYLNEVFNFSLSSHHVLDICPPEDLHLFPSIADVVNRLEDFIAQYNKDQMYKDQFKNFNIEKFVSEHQSANLFQDLGSVKIM